MTSLIDVIFLLLLFFMLSSTFSRFGEVELTAAAGGNMLIFFLVAGRIAPPLEADLQLVHTKDLASSPPPNALVIHADGRLSHMGQNIADPARFLTGLPAEMQATVRIVPDRDLAASQLVRIGQKLRQAGAGKILIVSERGLR
jgi:biopolymer transport protein ExbD